MERNLLLLSVFLGLMFGDDTFWLSYRSVTLNNVLIYEKKSISPLMASFVGKKVFTCRVKVDTKNCNTKLNCLNHNFYKILPCFYKVPVKITSQSQTTLHGTKDEVELILTPTRFIVDFKDDFANITILK